ncbi:MAG: recombination protein RecR [Lachnospiraceae bacterium]|nr:recombination protein RecR [Lachnospiraceae bacterium]
MDTSQGFQKLTQELGKLPGIGQKTAARLAYYLLNQPQQQVEELAAAMLDARKNVRYCIRCCTLTDAEICPICADEKRNHRQIMVVENPRDLEAYEKTGRYDGLYHVLHGVISPSRGIGFSEIRLKELMQRMQGESLDEVIIATGSTLEGETTAMYISQIIKPTGIKTTRIASGVPVGGELENTDSITLSRALEERREL